MEKLSIARGIVQYRFPPAEGKHYGFNITALLDEGAKQALLIDTAYEEEAAAVRGALEAAGYTIARIVISHFHPDHVLGLNALPEVPILGSPRAEETLSQFGERTEWERFLPTLPVNETDTVEFGLFRLRFRFAPGHSACSAYTLIDDGFIHVADNVMTSNAGQDILPWAAYDLIEAHIQSLEMLRESASRTLLLSHGIMLEDADTIEAAIANRIEYFRAILEGEGRISYEEATANCTCDFLHKEWLIRAE